MSSLLADPELVLCSWTVPDATFQERVRAAAGSGYAGIGLRHRDYRAAREAGASDGDLRGLLEQSGIRVVELDSVFDWMLDGEAAARSRATEDNLYRVADAVGAVHLVVNPNPRGMFEETAAVPLELKAERFSGVCDRAAEHGLLVALEFLPWTGIPHASDAWDIVRIADRPNGGVLVDSWHHFRGAADADLLLAIPPQRIVALQINDADPQPVGTLLEDSFCCRRFPGEGSFDLVGFLRLLDDHGVVAPLGVEVMADDLRGRDAHEVAGDAAAALHRVIQRATS